jgi:hypothetical protein
LSASCGPRSGVSVVVTVGTAEGPFWVPGAVEPLEPASLRWTGTTTTRWVVHANGQWGLPSHDIELGAINGPARVLVVAGKPEAYPAEEHQRHRAEQLLASLPTMQRRSRDARRTVLGVWQDPGAWVPGELVVDGELLPARQWSAASGEWCAVARTGRRRVQLAGSGIELPELTVRAVQRWAPYGADLQRPQPASVLLRMATAVLPDWESVDRSR